MKIYEVNPFATAIFALIVFVLTDLEVLNEALNTVVLVGTIALIVYKFLKIRKEKSRK